MNISMKLTTLFCKPKKRYRISSMVMFEDKNVEAKNTTSSAREEV